MGIDPRQPSRYEVRTELGIVSFEHLEKEVMPFGRIDADVSFGEKYAERLFELSRLYDVSTYGSAYLELAIRKHSTLATLDERLIRACETAGVGIILCGIN